MSQSVTDIGQLALHLKAILVHLNNEKDKALASGDLAGLLTFYHTLDLAYDALDEQRKAVYKELDFLNKNAIPEKLEASGMDKVRVPALGRSFYIVPKYTASIKPDKRPDAFEWLRSAGNGDIITETVNAQTLAAFLKDRLLNEGQEAPSELFTFNSYNTIGSAKYTPKGEK